MWPEEKKRGHIKKGRRNITSELKELEYLRNINESQAFYQKLNKSRKDFQRRTKLSKDKEGRILSGDEIILGRWVQYFDELLTVNVSDQSEDIGIMESHEDREIVEPPPTTAEVAAVIEKLKNNKASGMDFIQAELVKHARTEYTKYLHQLIVKIWINDIISEELNLGIICPIHRKADVMTCSNYWGISLLCTTYKIFSNILFKRLVPYVDSVNGDPQVIRSSTYVKCLKNVTNLELKHVTSSHILE
jgi:hypothetical protein